MEKQLYNVFVLEDNGETFYEVTTDNFKKWLEQHNKVRVAEGAEAEAEFQFEVSEVRLVTYDKE